MDVWLVASSLAVVGLAATLVGLFAGGRAPRRGARPPAWLLPTPAEARATRFPLAWRGYDPAWVDAHLDALATAYELLYLAADEDSRARARAQLERMAQRHPPPEL